MIETFSYRIVGDRWKGQRYIGVAMAKLQNLKYEMSLAKLSQGRSVYTQANGVIIECVGTYGNFIATINTVKRKKKIIIKKDEIQQGSGFLVVSKFTNGNVTAWLNIGKDLINSKRDEIGEREVKNYKEVYVYKRLPEEEPYYLNSYNQPTDIENSVCAYTIKPKFVNKGDALADSVYFSNIADVTKLEGGLTLQEYIDGTGLIRVLATDDGTLYYSQRKIWQYNGSSFTKTGFIRGATSGASTATVVKVNPYTLMACCVTTAGATLEIFIFVSYVNAVTKEVWTECIRRRRMQTVEYDAVLAQTIGAEETDYRAGYGCLTYPNMIPWNIVKDCMRVGSLAGIILNDDTMITGIVVNTWAHKKESPDTTKPPTVPLQAKFTWELDDSGLPPRTIDFEPEPSDPDFMSDPTVAVSRRHNNSGAYDVGGSNILPVVHTIMSPSYSDPAFFESVVARLRYPTTKGSEYTQVHKYQDTGSDANMLAYQRNYTADNDMFKLLGCYVPSQRNIIFVASSYYTRGKGKSSYWYEMEWYYDEWHSTEYTECDTSVVIPNDIPLLPEPRLEFTSLWWRLYEEHPQTHAEYRALEPFPEDPSVNEVGGWHYRYFEFANSYGVISSHTAPLGNGPVKYNRDTLKTENVGYTAPTLTSATDAIKINTLVTTNDCHNGYCFTIDNSGLFDLNDYPDDGYIDLGLALLGYSNIITTQHLDDRNNQSQGSTALFYRAYKNYDSTPCVGEVHLFIDGIDYYSDVVKALKLLYETELETDPISDDKLVNFMALL